MPAQIVTSADRREALIESAGEAESVGGLFGAASERLHRLVPHDAAVWMATDPATNLPTAPTRSENIGTLCNLDPAECLRVWEREFLIEDVNLYRELARASTPAGGLRLATRDRPARSPRYREFLHPGGFGDELRAVLRVGGSPWASVSLMRAQGRAAFSAAEVELMADLSDPLAQAVRDHARHATGASDGATGRGPGAGEGRRPRPADGRGPGLMLFAADGELISVNDDAHAWLEELPPELADAIDCGPRLPMVVLGTLMRARAIAAERDHGSARARMRSASGRWLVCHASALRDAGGKLGDTALVIEPAKGSEIAPIIVEAYELTARERQITQLISRGLPSAEISARLHLSVHTVRDYVKAIFEKVGVSSRGELVAKLFAEHYGPIHLDPANHELADV